MPNASAFVDKKKEQRSVEPTVLHALLTFEVLVIWLYYGLFELKADLHSVLILAMVWVTINGLLLRVKYAQLQQAMINGAQRAMPAMFIFLMIGIVIVSFIQSGTVATLIYYGLTFLHPAIFLPSGLILCSIISLAVGTSWGTIATGGIVLMGVGEAMGIPLPIIAGMVISGACFGDKMSPVSDTTNLASVSCDVNIYEHIRSMAYTTVPSYIITIIIFTYVGLSYSEQSLPLSELTLLTASLEKVFTINIFMLLPMVVLLVLSFKGIAAEAAMLIASLSAIIIALTVQDFSVFAVVNGLYEGANIKTGVEHMDKLLNKGGISSMAWTFTLAFVAICLGSIMQSLRFLDVLVIALLKELKRTGSIVSSAIVATFFGNCTFGDSYVALIISANMFKKKFDDRRIDRRVLSRSIEEGGTLLTGLIPWTNSGIYYAATLGVPTMDYIKWSVLNLVNPLVGITFAFLGLALFRAKPKKI